MNDKQDKRFEQLLKTASIDFSYKPGPLMEEKIIKRIKRQKYLSRFYKVSIGVVIVLIALFLGGQELGLKKIDNVFSLIDLLEQHFVKNGKDTNFKLQTDFSTKNFNISSSDFSVVENWDNEKNNSEESKENSKENGDNMFKMIRYVSIADDGGW
uniref:Uncharacterized protein n=1 Tax=Fervidobacterium nodosum TaxID=2424 RepID=A0A7C5YDB4_9BACT